MNSQKKKKLWILTGIALLGMVLIASVVFRQGTPIQAESENSTQETISTYEIAPAKDVSANLSMETRALDPVENEEGLKFTPKVLVLAQNAAFPNLGTEAGRNQLFSEQVIPQPMHGATYKYVNEDGQPITPKSTETGFQVVYVEIQENYELTSIRVPIPVTVTDAGTTMTANNKAAIQAEYTSGKIVLYPDEVNGKDAAQIQELVKSKTKLRAWNAETGEEVPASVGSTTISTTTVGTYKATLEADLGTEKATTEKDVVVFGADPLAFVTIARNGTLVLSTAPTNLFSKFQTFTNTTATNATYQFVDENNAVLSRLDTSQVGFKWAYIKMTDKTNGAISTVIKVPVSVTSTGTTITSALLTNQVMVKADSVTIYPSETKGKSNAELLELIESKSNLSAWNMSTGEAVPVSYTSTTATSNSIGSFNGTITVTFDVKQATTTRVVTAFGAKSKSITTNIGNAIGLGTNGANALSSYQTTTSNAASDATYTWVTDEIGMTPISGNYIPTKVGFQYAYVKMTDKKNTAISTVIPVTLNIFAENRALNLGTIGLDYQSFLLRSDIAGKTVPQINSILTEKIVIDAWEMSTGDSLTAKVTSSNIVESSRGDKTVGITVTTKGGGTINQNVKISIVPDEVFGDDTISDWVPVLKGTDQGKIVNPINKSTAGFANRGMTDSMTTDLGFIIRDAAGVSYLYS